MNTNKSNTDNSNTDNSNTDNSNTDNSNTDNSSSNKIELDIKRIPVNKKLLTLHADLFKSSELSQKILLERIKAAYTVILDRKKVAIKKTSDELIKFKKEFRKLDENINEKTNRLNEISNNPLEEKK